MISKAPKLLIVGCALAAAGCTSLPQAGLVYSSTAMVGVGMKVSTADATSPVDIAIGFKMHDFAYVPVAVQEMQPQGGTGGGTSGGSNHSVQKIWASHAQSEGANARCDSERAKVTNKTQLSPAEQKALDIACDIKRDAMSVYGQFNGTGSASGADRGAGLAVGKIFSTGVAAQNVSGSIHVTAIAECVKAVTATFTATATQELKDKRIDQLCTTKL